MWAIRNAIYFPHYLDKLENVAESLETKTMVVGRDAAESGTPSNFFLLPITIREIWRWEWKKKLRLKNEHCRPDLWIEHSLAFCDVCEISWPNCSKTEKEKEDNEN